MVQLDPYVTIVWDLHVLKLVHSQFLVELEMQNTNFTLAVSFSPKFDQEPVKAIHRHYAA